jgi:hypothetical protein
MIKHLLLPHQQFVAYLLGKSDREAQASIRRLAEEDGAYQVLFELIDRFKRQATLRAQPKIARLPETFHEVEEMLEGFFSGKAGDEKAQQFLDGLVTSPQFYQRLLAKLKVVAPQMASDEIPEMSQIRIESDEEILEKVIAGANGKTLPAFDNNFARVMPNLLANLGKFIDGVFRKPRLAFAFALMLAVVSITVWQVEKNRYGLDEAYSYDTKVPYPFVSGWRGPSSSAADEALFHSFVNAYKLGMTNYVVCDYAGAINVLEKWDSFAAGLLPKFAHNKNVLLEIRDYSFYLGVSHFALARSQRAKPAPEEKTQHLKSAIRLLARADSLARTQQVEDNDREIYFLGLAYGFGGQPDSAVARLRQIKPESDFYNDSSILAKAWSKN